MTFLNPPEITTEVEKLYADDIAEDGYVMNVSLIWGYRPSLQEGLFGLLRDITKEYELTMRQRGILVAACASAFGDSYCALKWGTRLAAESDTRTASEVLRGEDIGLSDAERAMAAWARKVARDPNAVVEADVQRMRDCGWEDAEIFAITVFVALRIAFSTVNDALGARPDAGLRQTTPPDILEAVTFGRPIADG
ncbi:hypothetical protein J5X84_12075 [Streptosporangiaceae bacterium NEAU-GS5]|nr:hypothetical protein [Streptosporangiaceae bacterium NEAU-GS5]